MIVIAIGLGWYYRSEVQDYLLKLAGEKLNATIEVQSIEVSFLRRFPQVNVQVNGLKINLKPKTRKKYQFATSQFLRAKQLSFQLNLLAFFRKQYQVKAIRFNNIQLALNQSNSGKWNYEVITEKLKSNSGANSNLQLNLNQIHCENAELWLSVPNFETKLTEIDLVLSGFLSKQEFDLDIKSNAIIAYIKHTLGKSLKEKPIQFTVQLTVNKPKSEFRIQKSSIRLAEFGLVITGLLRTSKQGIYQELEFHGESAEFAKVISLLPSSWLKTIEGTEISGKFESEGSLKGWLGNNQIPGLDVKFQLTNGMVSVPKSNASLSELGLLGKLYYPANQSGKPYLELKQIQGKLSQQPFYGNFSIELVSNPQFQTNFKGIVDWLALRTLFTGLSDSIQFSGVSEVTIELGGRWNDVIQKRFQNSYGKGSIFLRNVNFQHPALKKVCSNLTGSFQLANDQLEIQKLTGLWGNQPFRLSGNVAHYLPWLLGQSVPLQLQVQLETNFLNFEDWIQPSTDTIPKGIILPAIEAKIAAKFDSFQLFTLQGKQLSGLLEINPKKIQFSDLRFEALGGKFISKGTIWSGLNPSVELQASLQSVRLENFLDTYPQLGGISLVKGHLFGTCFLDGNFKTKLSPKLEIIPATLLTKAQVRITGGKLIQFKPLEKLSWFVKDEKLKEIYFQDLENTLSIENSRLWIPKMNIFANDWRMTIEGSHGFDQSLDYHFQYFLRKKKPDAAKQTQSWVEVNPKPNREGWSIKIHITGTANEPKFSWDKEDNKNQEKNSSQFQEKTKNQPTWIELEPDTTKRKKRKNKIKL
ncbi:MAG: AsmA-like C-terminal region-containing protein [Bacteroidia bacterium]|nr:AsmA-like C-terminal region-containing protein [Bacteroidia bacterium]